MYVARINSILLIRRANKYRHTKLLCGREGGVLQNGEGYYNRNYRSLKLTSGDDGGKHDVTGALMSLSSTRFIGAFPSRRFELLMEVDLSRPASSGRPVD
jgi:hypothetical protein